MSLQSCQDLASGFQSPFINLTASLLKDKKCLEPTNQHSFLLTFFVRPTITDRKVFTLKGSKENKRKQHISFFSTVFVLLAVTTYKLYPARDRRKNLTNFRFFHTLCVKQKISNFLHAWCLLAHIVLVEWTLDRWAYGPKFGPYTHWSNVNGEEARRGGITYYPSPIHITTLIWPYIVCQQADSLIASIFIIHQLKSSLNGHWIKEK